MQSLCSLFAAMKNAKLWFRVDQEMTSWQTGLRHILPDRAWLLKPVSRATPWWKLNTRERVMHRWNIIMFNLILSLFFVLMKSFQGPAACKHIYVHKKHHVSFCVLTRVCYGLILLILNCDLQWPMGWWVPICTTIPKSCLSFSWTHRCLLGILPHLGASQPWRISGR